MANFLNCSVVVFLLINLLCFTSCKEEPTLPVVKTINATGITRTTVTAGGNVTDDGGANVSSRGVCWDTIDNPTIGNSATYDGVGIGSFTSSLVQLRPDTKYYLRAYATNSSGTGYGTSNSFNTIAGIVFNPDLIYGSISDIDGNVYKTIQIGNQVWMAENLKTTRLNNNIIIPLITDQNTWDNLTSPAYCWYDNELSNKEAYGALYNWFTVNTKKLCPAGWHVPTDSEWTILENFLIANGYNYDGSKTGNKIGKALSAPYDWNPSTNIGAVGNTDFSTFRNKSGFTALPCGGRICHSRFEFMGEGARLWSSTETYSNAYYRSIWFSESVLSSYSYSQKTGLCVRCLKD